MLRTAEKTAIGFRPQCEHRRFSKPDLFACRRSRLSIFKHAGPQKCFRKSGVPSFVTIRFPQPSLLHTLAIVRFLTYISVGLGFTGREPSETYKQRIPLPPTRRTVSSRRMLSNCTRQTRRNASTRPSPKPGTQTPHTWLDRFVRLPRWQASRLGRAPATLRPTRPSVLGKECRHQQ